MKKSTTNATYLSSPSCLLSWASRKVTWLTEVYQFCISFATGQKCLIKIGKEVQRKSILLVMQRINNKCHIPFLSFVPSFLGFQKANLLPFGKNNGQLLPGGNLEEKKATINLCSSTGHCSK